MYMFERKKIPKRKDVYRLPICKFPVPSLQISKVVTSLMLMYTQKRSNFFHFGQCLAQLNPFLVTYLVTCRKLREFSGAKMLSCFRSVEVHSF